MSDNDTLMEVHRALGRLEGKIDTLVSQAATDRTVITRMNDRVSKLENWRNYLLGAWVVLAGFGAVALRVILK